MNTQPENLGHIYYDVTIGSESANN